MAYIQAIEKDLTTVEWVAKYFDCPGADNPYATTRVVDLANFLTTPGRLIDDGLTRIVLGRMVEIPEHVSGQHRDVVIGDGQPRNIIGHGVIEPDEKSPDGVYAISVSW